MSQKIQLRRSAIPGKLPTTGDLDLGEVAINTSDGKFFFKKDDGVSTEIIELLSTATAASTYHPLSTSLTNITSLGGLSGFLVKNGSNSWTLDTTDYSDAASLTSGTISTAILGSGLADSTVFLRGDNSWSNTFTGELIVNGNLTVNGTTTTINATTLSVSDKNIDLAVVTTPSDTTANGGGITLKGTTDKTIIWDSLNNNWTSSENWNLASGKVFKINNTTILSETALTIAGEITAQTFMTTTGGTAAAPVIMLNNDTNTGIYSDNTDQIGFTTGGTIALTLDSVGNTNIYGNVGVGTSSTTHPLYARSLIVQPGGLGSAILSVSNYNNTILSNICTIESMGSRNDNNSTFGGRFAACFRRSDGTAIGPNINLGYYAFGGQHGVDTTYQSSKTLCTASISGVSEASFTSATSMPTAIVFKTGNTGALISDVNQSYGTERMRITSTGDVGIGVTPSANNMTGALHNTYGLVTYNSGSLFSGNILWNSGWKYLGLGYGSLIRHDTTAGIMQFMMFGNNVVGSGETAFATEAMIIHSNGNTELNGSLGVKSANASSNVAINSAITLPSNQNNYGMLSYLYSTDETLTSNRYHYGINDIYEMQGKYDENFSIYGYGVVGTARTSASSGYSQTGYGLLFGGAFAGANHSNDATHNKINNLYGSINTAQCDGDTSYSANAYGIYSQVQTGGTAASPTTAITNAYGIYSNIYTVTNRNIDNAYVLYLNQTGTGTVNNNTYGIYDNTGWDSHFSASVYAVMFDGYHVNGTANGSKYANFEYNTISIGSITQATTSSVAFNTTSDQRLKTNILDAESALPNVLNLQVRSFDWKDDAIHEPYGMIAQEVVNVAPNVVHVPENPDEYMGIDYAKLVPMLTKALQEVNAKLDTLQADFDAYKLSHP